MVIYENVFAAALDYYARLKYIIVTFFSSSTKILRFLRNDMRRVLSAFLLLLLLLFCVFLLEVPSNSGIERVTV